MSNYNPMNLQQGVYNAQQVQQNQFPYGNNNMLLGNTPYENYMGRINNSQNLLQQPNQFLKCRPVSSKEEARAFQIDLDGSLWVFTDLGNEKVYTKQINTDGTATFKTYGLIQDQNPYSSNQYVTKEQFNKVIQTLMAAIQPGDSQQPVNTAPKEQSNVLNF